MFGFGSHRWLFTTRILFAADDGGGSEAPPSSPASGDGGGGGSSAPSPASSPAPSATPSRSAPGPASEAAALAGGAPVPGAEWTNMGSADDLDELEIQALAQEPTPQTPQAPQPQVAPQALPPQAQAPQVSAAATQDPSSAAQPYSASDPWRIAEGLEANRDAVVAHLAQAKFALTPEEIQEVETDAVAAIPKLLSRVFFESQVSMQKFLAQAVPGMMKQFTTVTTANNAAEKQFFAMHRALDINNPQHRAMATRIATVYRQANPNIPLNQLIAEVGPMVMTALQMNAQAPAPQARSAAAFRPAVNGGGGVSPTPAAPNPWEGMGRHYDE